MDQTIRFCTAPDGARIAYAVAGKGPPIVKVGNYLTHLEFDWESPVWRHLLEGLAEHRQLIRYDVRALLPQVKIPTLILHSRGDRRIPLDIGRELAANIAGSRFVTLESNNHLILEHEPATEVFFDEVAKFLGDEKRRSWKRAVRATEGKLQKMARGVETSATYKILGMVAAVASVISFIVWLLA